MRKNIVSLAILFLVSWQAVMANCLSVDAHDKPHFISDGATSAMWITTSRQTTRNTGRMPTF